MATNYVIQDKTNNPTVKVTIGNVLTEDVYSKRLRVYTYPTTRANQDVSVGAKTTKILDLLQVEKRLLVTGVLGTGLGTVSPEQSSASAKRSDLKKLFEAGGVLSVQYGGETFQANIEKLNIREKPTDESDISYYDVKFTLVIGVNLV